MEEKKAKCQISGVDIPILDGMFCIDRSNGDVHFVAKGQKVSNDFYQVETKTLFSSPESTIDWLAHLYSKRWFDAEKFFSFIYKFRAHNRLYGMPLSTVPPQSYHLDAVHALLHELVENCHTKLGVDIETGSVILQFHHGRECECGATEPCNKPPILQMFIHRDKANSIGESLIQASKLAIQESLVC